MIPYVSVVVPVYNESASIPALLSQIHEALETLGKPYEVLIVDDGSDDASWETIQELQATYPELIACRLSRNFGQTAALMAGIDRTHGEIVITMDGDLQNDPADIPKMIEKVEDGYEIVSGWRRHRQDRFLTRRLPSLLANVIARWVTGLAIHDQGCSLKAYRGRVLRSISLYSDFHRFVVPLTQVGGARVSEVETNHRHREFGRSKYGVGRTLRVVADLVTLTMITRFSDRLFLWFLIFAALPFFLAVIALIWIVTVILQPNPGSMLVPIGSCALLFQSVFTVVAYAFLAEHIRHLASTKLHRRQGLLATLSILAGPRPGIVLIRGEDVVPLSEGRNETGPIAPGVAS